MDSKKLKLYIQKLIKEELSSNLKEIIRENLIEILSNNAMKSNNGSNHIMQPKQKISELPINESPKKSNKSFVKYTSNKLLNDVLNETVGGIPYENGVSSVLESAYGSPQSNLVSENAPESVKKVNSIINRDFSSTMKAIDNIKKSKN